MTQFSYEIIIDDLPRNRYGNGPMNPNGVTIHHSAVQASNDAGYDPIRRAKQYANHHMSLNGGIAYHIFIPYDDLDKIYVCQYFNTWTHHNSNYQANRQTLAILVDGNFQVENPHPKQLAKLRQILDDLADKWFETYWKNSVLNNINPKDNSTIRSYSGLSVKTLHYHNEVAQPGNSTACCGANLIPYVIDYREKNGNVEWGVEKEKVPEYIANSRDIPNTRYVAIQDTSLIEINTGKVVKPFPQGSEFDISRITKYKGVEYAITAYSASKNIYNGIPLNTLIIKEEMDKIIKENNELKKQIEELQAKINNNYMTKAEVGLHYVSKLEYQKVLDEKMTQLEQARLQYSDMQRQLEDAQSQNSDLQKQLEEARSQNLEIKNQLQEARSLITELQRQLDETKLQILELQRQLEEAKSQNLELQKQTEDAKTAKLNTIEYKFTKLWNSISPRIRYYWPYVTGFIGGLIAVVNFDQDWQTVLIAVITYIFTYINGLKAVEGIAKDQKKEIIKAREENL